MRADVVYEYIKNWKESCGDGLNPAIRYEMDALMSLCKKEMLDNDAKRSGVKTIVSAANRIIKRAKTNQREILHGMFPNTVNFDETLWCVCDGCCAVRFKDKMPLEEVAAKGDLFNLNNVCMPVNNAVEIQLPSIVDVKLAVKENVVKNSKGKKVGQKPMCVNEEISLYVNPQYLLDMMECLPNAKMYAGNNVSAIYFEADNGDGVLLPVKPPKKD